MGGPGLVGREGGRLGGNGLMGNGLCHGYGIGEPKAPKVVSNPHHTTTSIEDRRFLGRGARL